MNPLLALNECDIVGDHAVRQQGGIFKENGDAPFLCQPEFRRTGN